MFFPIWFTIWEKSVVSFKYILLFITLILYFIKFSKNLANLNWHLKPTQLDKKVINERRDRSVASIMPMSSIQGIPYMEPL